MLEAPITGGLEALKKGQMTVFMAGDKDLAEMVCPSSANNDLMLKLQLS